MSGNEAAPGCSGRLRGCAPADGAPVSFPPDLTAQLRNQRREPDPRPGPGVHLARHAPDVLGFRARSAAPGKVTQDERVGT